MKGADRNIKDYELKVPLDYAIERRFKTIEVMLRNKIGLIEKYGLKSSYMKVNPSKKPYYLFICMYLFQLIMTVIFTFPCNSMHFKPSC